jgi:hypothetical protein
MIRRILIIFCFVCLTSCDDGDIITVDLAFDQDLELCTNNTESFLIYDTREDPNESLSLIIDRGTDEDYPFTVPTPSGTPTLFTINASSNRFIYRTYNRAIATGELCDPIPPANLNIVEDYEATAGTVEAYVAIEDDDDDGIPSDLEGRGLPDENGDYPNAQDSDGDGIPDYQDEDDDNDNVLTEDEIDELDLDGDDDPTTNPLDTDSDGMPDYLDEDDDGDGVLTIEEDADGDKNPRNDTSNNNGILIPLYLNNLELVNHGFPGYRDDNEYTRTVTITFFVNDINLQILSTEQIDFGTLSYPITFPQDE